MFYLHLVSFCTWNC